MKNRIVIVIVIVLVVMGSVPVSANSTGAGTPAGVGQAPPLPEAFEAYDLRVNYPADWAARSQEGWIEIVNDPMLYDLLDNEADDAMPSGALVLRIRNPAGLAKVTDRPLLDIMATVADAMGVDPATTDLRDTTVRDYPAVQFAVSNPATDSEAAVVGFWVDDRRVALVTLSARQDELSAFEATTRAIMASIESTAATRTHEVWGLTMTAPAAWGFATHPEFAVLASSEDALNNYMAGVPFGMTRLSEGDAVFILYEPYTGLRLNGRNVEYLSSIIWADLRTSETTSETYFDDLTLGGYYVDISKLWQAGAYRTDEITIFAIELAEDAIVVALGINVDGDYTRYERTFHAIIASMTFAPDVLAADTTLELNEPVSALGMTFMIPDRWWYDVGPDQITILDSFNTWVPRERQRPFMRPGQNMLVVIRPTTPAEWDGMTLPEAVVEMARALRGESSTLEYDAPVETTLRGVTAYSAALTISSQLVAGEVVGFETADGRYIIVISFSHIDQHDAYRDLIWDIIASIDLVE